MIPYPSLLPSLSLSVNEKRNIHRNVLICKTMAQVLSIECRIVVLKPTGISSSTELFPKRHFYLFSSLASSLACFPFLYRKTHTRFDIGRNPGTQCPVLNASVPIFSNAPMPILLLWSTIDSFLRLGFLLFRRFFRPFFLGFFPPIFAPFSFLSRLCMGNVCVCVFGFVQWAKPK